MFIQKPKVSYCSIGPGESIMVLEFRELLKNACYVYYLSRYSSLQKLHVIRDESHIVPEVESVV